MIGDLDWTKPGTAQPRGLDAPYNHSVDDNLVEDAEAMVVYYRAVVSTGYPPGMNRPLLGSPATQWQPGLDAALALLDLVSHADGVSGQAAYEVQALVELAPGSGAMQLQSILDRYVASQGAV